MEEEERRRSRERRRRRRREGRFKWEDRGKMVFSRSQDSLRAKWEVRLLKSESA